MDVTAILMAVLLANTIHTTAFQTTCHHSILLTSRKICAEARIYEQHVLLLVHSIKYTNTFYAIHTHTHIYTGCST